MKTKCVMCGISLFIIITGCVFDSDSTPAPKDEELIKIFNENKEIFIQLQSMMYNDGYVVISVIPEWSDPGEISSEKKEKYYELLKKINVVQIRKRSKDTLVYTVWNTGNVSGGDSKGYVFKPEYNGIREEKESLDNIITFENEFFYLRKIDGEWFLFYDHFL